VPGEKQAGKNRARLIRRVALNSSLKSVYIGLGSNLNQPAVQIKKAIQALSSLPDSSIIADSGYFISKPMGPEDQPDYMNAVVQMRTALAVTELLACCQQIEKQQGRIKKRHWGERTIDLDILLYEDIQIESENLTIPHPGICQRDFVYKPLLKLNSELEIPGKGLLHVIKDSTVEINSDFACQFAGEIE
jgi:2-amino-4-hydroxy-6-hydroxymethyldihydropteridine diphosphokinase